MKLFALVLCLFGLSAQAQFFPDFTKLTEEMATFNANMTTFSGSLDTTSSAIGELTESINTMTGTSVPDMIQGVSALTTQISDTTQTFQAIATMYEPQVAQFNQNASAIAEQAKAFNGNFAELNSQLSQFQQFLHDPKALFTAGFAASAGATAGAIATGFVLNGVLNLVTSTVTNFVKYQKEKGQIAVKVTEQSLDTIEKLSSFNSAFDTLNAYLENEETERRAKEFLAKVEEEQERFEALAKDEEDRKLAKLYLGWSDLLEKIGSYVKGVMKNADRLSKIIAVRINSFKQKYFQVVLSLTISYHEAYKYSQQCDQRQLKQARKHIAGIFKAMGDEEPPKNVFERLKDMMDQSHQRDTKETMAYLSFQFTELNSENEKLIGDYLELVWADLRDEAEAYFAEAQKNAPKKSLITAIREVFKRWQEKLSPKGRKAALAH